MESSIAMLTAVAFPRQSARCSPQFNAGLPIVRFARIYKPLHLSPFANVIPAILYNLEYIARLCSLQEHHQESEGPL